MSVKGRKVGVYEALPAIMERLSLPIPECGCYAWLGGDSGKDDYGRVRWQESDGRRRTGIAHRVAYELVKGPAPEGWEVDHLCNQPWCVNPDHLEAVTPEEHIKRRRYTIQPFCTKGHPRIPSNVKRGRGQRWICPVCRSNNARQWHASHPEWLKQWEATRTIERTASGYWNSDAYLDYRRANKDRINAQQRERRAKQKENRFGSEPII